MQPDEDIPTDVRSTLDAMSGKKYERYDERSVGAATIIAIAFCAVNPAIILWSAFNLAMFWIFAAATSALVAVALAVFAIGLKKKSRLAWLSLLLSLLSTAIPLGYLFLSA